MVVECEDPCGTARLGKSIEQGVVDRELKVHGIKGLSVSTDELLSQQ
jgi:choline dehydrogenase-like flavoprotein